MNSRKVFHCVVDDSALTTNISELKKWVSQGAISLIVPVHTLERLRVLHKDGSQIGINAREAVKFLDRVTSGQDTIPLTRVNIQEPGQEFNSWAEVEHHFPELYESEQQASEENQVSNGNTLNGTEVKDNLAQEQPRSSNALSQMLLNKLNFAKAPEVVSPKSSPPTTPISSNPQSSKASPEVPLSALASHEKERDGITKKSKNFESAAVPDAIKPLINFVVWLFTKKQDRVQTLSEFLFLTNNGDKAKIVRGFGISVKNIHQLRSAILAEEQEIKNQTRYRQRNSASPPNSEVQDPADAKTLFKYDENSDDEEVVFKPRSRPTSGISSRGAKSGDSPWEKSNGRRARPISADRSPGLNATNKAENASEVPVLEIDPDSFDRGSSGRPSQPIFNPGGNHTNHSRPPSRGYFNTPGNSFASPRGGGFTRGPTRGFDRGTFRGRGRLFNG
ncbi:MAG: hypothetical protein Q9227_007220 [Pyrenula ochraceoflavens]